MAELKRRKEQLVEAFIYQKAIDEGTYKEQLDKLNEAMALAEIDQHDQRTEELDIEAVLGFAERVSLNAPRLWLEASLDQRQRFQSFLFPEGIQVADGELRTPVTTSFYEELHSFTTQEERMVAPGVAKSNTCHTLRPSAFVRLEKFLWRLDSFRRQDEMRNI